MDAEKILSKYKIKPDAILDQHFLNDEDLVDELLEDLKIDSKDIVFEVGPGIGTFTSRIRKSKKIIAVEIDPKLCTVLKKEVECEIICGNALHYVTQKKFTKLVSSTPYSICEPLLRKLFVVDFEIALVIVPEGFATKILENSTIFGLITNEFLEITKTTEVPSSKFFPVPKTSSNALVIQKKPKSHVQEFLLQDDKLAKNALRETLAKMGITKKKAKEQINTAFKKQILEKKVNLLTFDELGEILAFLKGF